MSLVVLCSACKADVRVDVTWRADGTGTVAVEVVLDADAVRRVTQFAPLEQAVPVTDLRDAGWDVGAWSTGGDGAASVWLPSELGAFAGELRSVSPQAADELAQLPTLVERALT